jgi:hypothetical protein
MLLNNHKETLVYCYLIEPELRQLHRRFGHPLVQRLANLLSYLGHKFK